MKQKVKTNKKPSQTKPTIKPQTHILWNCKTEKAPKWVFQDEESMNLSPDLWNS